MIRQEGRKHMKPAIRPGSVIIEFVSCSILQLMALVSQDSSLSFNIVSQTCLLVSSAVRGD
jgi:hypothetical protein